MSTTAHHREEILKAIRKAKQGTVADEEQRYSEAIMHYEHCLDIFAICIKNESKNLPRRRLIIKKCVSLNERLDVVREYYQTGKVPKKKNPKKVIQKEEEEEVRKFRKHSSIITDFPTVKWKDVYGLEDAKQRLQEIVIFPLKFPQLFHSSRRNFGMCVCGPSGTGKSLITKAVVAESGASLFWLSTYDLLFRYTSDSWKIVATAVELAGENKPSIIVMDEIELLCEGQHTNEGIHLASNKIWLELGVLGQAQRKMSNGIQLILMTRFPWKLNNRIKRLIEPRYIYTSLPDESSRTKFISSKIVSLLQNDVCRYEIDEIVTKEQVAVLAKGSKGMSCSDISGFLVHACMKPIKRCQKATHFVLTKVKDKIEEFWTPCLSSFPTAVKMRQKDINLKRLLVPKPSFDDFLQSMKQVKPSIGKKDLEPYAKFKKETNSY